MSLLCIDRLSNRTAGHIFAATLWPHGRRHGMAWAMLQKGFSQSTQCLPPCPGGIHRFPSFLPSTCPGGQFWNLGMGIHLGQMRHMYAPHLWRTKAMHVIPRRHYAATSGPSNTVLRTPSYLPHPITLFLHETILFFQAHHARQTSKCPCTCTSTHLSEYSLTEMFTDLIQSGGGCSRYFAHDGCHPLYLH